LYKLKPIVKNLTKNLHRQNNDFYERGLALKRLKTIILKE